MYFLCKFCCFCSAKDNLLNLSDQDSDGITHIHKLTASLVGMDLKEMDEMRFICGECCTTLNTVYRFQQNCLRSKRNLATYVSQLQTFSRVRGTLSVCLRDIRQGKSQTTLTNIKQEDSQSAVSDLVNFVYIKQEYNSDEEDHYVREDVIKNDAGIGIKEERAESVNMDYSDGFYMEKFIPKVEYGHSDTEHETTNQSEVGDHYSSVDEDFIENQYVEPKKEIDIEGHPLCDVKEEAVSDSETPAEGPSQGDRSADAVLDTATGKPIKRRNRRKDNGPYICPTCNKECKSRKLLTCHVKIHSVERKFECKVCKKRFYISGHLTAHMESHTSERQYKCEICDKRFLRNSYLTTHMKLHSDERPFGCEICQKRFISKSYLTIHMRRHSDARPHQCEMCEKNFSRKDQLHLHVQTHTGEKPFECEICKKKFSRKVYLTLHMRLHTGERPYECDICKEAFIRNDYLTAHMRIHTGEKPYECEVCKKTFHVKKRLTYHMKSHSAQGPYKCEICGKKITTKHSFAMHMQMHTGVKHHECEICKKSFFRRQSLVEHMQCHD